MKPMAVMKITGQGLGAIGVLVVALGGCIFMESHVVRTAQLETARSLRELQDLRLRRPIVPALQPVAPRIFRPSIG